MRVVETSPSCITPGQPGSLSNCEEGGRLSHPLAPAVMPMDHHGRSRAPGDMQITSDLR